MNETIMTSEKLSPVFSRSPRFVTPLPEETIEIPEPPQEPAQPANSLVYSLLPLAITIAALVVVSLVAKMQTLLYFSVPLMVSSAIGSIFIYRKQKKDIQQKRAERKKKYEALLKKYRNQIRDLYQKQHSVRKDKDPGIQVCLRAAQQLDPLLWSRSPSDDDFLSIRVGLSNLPATVAIKLPENKNPIEPDPLILQAHEMAAQFHLLEQVPLCINLPAMGVLGFAGARKDVLESVFAFVLHLTTHHAPNEVKLAVLFSEEEREEWRWLRWLPHVWDDGRENRRLAAQPDEIQELLKFYENLLDERQRFAEDKSSAEDVAFSVYHVLIIAESVPANQLHILSRIQNDGPKLGVYAVFLSDRTSTLPAACRSVVRFHPQGAFVRLRNPTLYEYPLLPDKATSKELTEFALALAPVRLHGSSKREIPNRVSFLDMYSALSVDDLGVPNRWAQNRAESRTLSVPIGMTFGNQLLMLDLHERADGPNGLVAGTVGAGKSELLQTLILSLALNYPPDKLGFVLVDYKGGGMAKPFETLPHNFGVITDLEQKNLATRAIRSFDVELKKRKALFNEHEITHIDQYQRLYFAGKVQRPLPYLVVIVDEFAEMKSEQPETAQEFVRIARTGRALGLRLILAMQKPAGIVDGQIEANTRFRLCLRVAQTEDSQAMLKRPDAAYLRGLGRAYLQIGANEVFREFQVGYCGAEYDPTGTASDDPNQIALVSLNGKRTPLNRPFERDSIEEKTQLTVIVKNLTDINNSIPEAYLNDMRLWLPPLKEIIPLDSIPYPQSWNSELREWSATSASITPVIGMVDKPEEKRQEPLSIKLSDGHLAVYGAPGYGKTNLVQTLIVSLAKCHAPDEINIYVLDFGGHLLRQQFGKMPHVGAVICSDEDERIDRLFYMLRQQIGFRRKALGEAQVSSLQQYRAQGARDIPAIVFILENYAAFAQAAQDREDYHNIITRIAQDGVGLGIHLVITSTSPTGVRYSVANNILHAIALHLIEESEYSSIVGRIDDTLPEALPGRGLLRSNPALVCQIATPNKGTIDQERNSQLLALSEEMRNAWNGKPAAPVPVMPEEIHSQELFSAHVASQPGQTPLGLRASDLMPFVVDISDSSIFLVTGSNESGKSGLLLNWTVGLDRMSDLSDIQIFVFDSYSRSLSSLKSLRSVVAYSDSHQHAETSLQTLDEIMNQRIAMITSGDSKRSPVGRIVVVIDDIGDEQLGSMSEGSKNRLPAMIRRSQLAGVTFLVAGNTGDLYSKYSDTVRLMKEAQIGFVLGGSDDRIFNMRLPHSERNVALPMGEGYFVRRGQATRIKLAIPLSGAIDE